MKQNSTIGIRSTNFTLSVRGICQIIKQCEDSGVQEFEFQSLKIYFNPRRNEGAGITGQVPGNNSPQVDFDFSKKEELELMDQGSMLEAEEAQMLIDDPFSFEKAQIDRHIERSRGNG